MEEKTTGVLLLNFGAPQSIEEVEAFVMHICSGQKPSDYVLKMIKERYSSMGGGSTLLATTWAQAKVLEEELKKEGNGYPVYIGMLHSKPFIIDVVQQMVQDGIKRIIALSLAPFNSQVSTGAYYAQVRESAENSLSDIRISYGEEWYIKPSFIRVWAEKISACLKEFPRPEEVNLIFTTHSLPLEPHQDAEYYQRQYQATVDGVMKLLPHEKVHVAYQSKGKRRSHWLGPQVEEVMQELADLGENSVLVVPIGFVADHLETLYDLDIEVKKKAELWKMDFRRISTLNDDPRFIKALAELVLAMK